MQNLDPISFDYSAIEEGDFSVGNKGQGELVNYLGNAKTTWPLDVRLVVNTSSSAEAKPYHENHFHECMIGEQYIRVPCARVVGQSCMICDAHWSHRDQATQLETRGGKSENHPLHGEYMRHFTLAKMYKQQQRYAMLAVVRGDNKISWLETKPSLTKSIFGDKKKGVKGAVDAIKEFGVSVYNPFEATGWLKLSKTGIGLDTVYAASPTLTTKIENKRKSEELTEEKLHPSLIEKFKDPSKLLKINETIMSKLWSEEEIHAYVESAGTQVPERVLRKPRESKKTDDSFASSEAAKPAKSIEPIEPIETTSFVTDDFDLF